MSYRSAKFFYKKKERKKERKNKYEKSFKGKAQFVRVRHIVVATISVELSGRKIVYKKEERKKERKKKE